LADEQPASYDRRRFFARSRVDIVPRAVSPLCGDPEETMTGAAPGRVIVVMPAYNAARTLRQTFQDLPPNTIDEIILVDDKSADDTVAVARALGIDVLEHPENRGYGGNQKTCYQEAL